MENIVGKHVIVVNKIIKDETLAAGRINLSHKYLKALDWKILL